MKVTKQKPTAPVDVGKPAAPAVPTTDTKEPATDAKKPAADAKETTADTKKPVQQLGLERGSLFRSVFGDGDDSFFDFMRRQRTNLGGLPTGAFGGLPTGALGSGLPTGAFGGLPSGALGSGFPTGTLGGLGGDIDPKLGGGFDALRRFGQAVMGTGNTAAADGDKKGTGDGEGDDKKAEDTTTAKSNSDDTAASKKDE